MEFFFFNKEFNFVVKSFNFSNKIEHQEMSQCPYFDVITLHIFNTKVFDSLRSFISRIQS